MGWWLGEACCWGGSLMPSRCCWAAVTVSMAHISQCAFLRCACQQMFLWMGGCLFRFIDLHYFLHAKKGLLQTYKRSVMPFSTQTTDLTENKTRKLNAIITRLIALQSLRTTWFKCHAPFMHCKVALRT